MKTDDYEKLKKLCDENGFELVTEPQKENDKFYVVKKKPELVKITWISTSCDEIRFDYKDVPHLNLVKLGHELAEVLEKYLNDKQK
jgi:hypothetical protein